MNLKLRWVRSVTAALLQLLLVGTLIGIGGCAWLDVKQREFIYRPTPGIPASFVGLRAGDERYLLAVPHTTIEGGQTANGGVKQAQQVELWWLPHADRNAPTLLYFHGTFRNLFQNLPKLEALRHAGFAVLAVEYRGWGLSTPITPSEQTILQDADVAWAELQRREPQPQRRVIYGHSMGSGVAVDVASRLRAQQDYGALILESAFTSFPQIAQEANLFVGLLANLNNERFASIEKIARVQAPLLMIHGSADATTPIVLGERLYAAANKPKRWLTIEGGAHSNLHRVGQPQYQTQLQSFIQEHLLRPAP